MRDCFAQHRQFFSKEEMADLLASVRANVESGMTQDAAKVKAVEAALTEAKSDLNEIVAAIQKHATPADNTAAIERLRLEAEAKATEAAAKAREAEEAATTQASERARVAAENLEALSATARARMLKADPAILAERPAVEDWMTPEEKYRAAKFRSDIDNAPFIEPQLKIPASTHEMLRLMAQHSGWIERGGQAMRKFSEFGTGGDVVGRTSWVGQPPWARGFGMTPEEIQAAVEKAIAGKHLGAKQRGIVEAMLGELVDVQSLPSAKDAEPETIAAVAMEPTPEQWLKMSKGEQDAHIAALFPPAKAHARAAGSGKETPAGEVRQAGEFVPGEDDEEVTHASPPSTDTSPTAQSGGDNQERAAAASSVREGASRGSAEQETRAQGRTDLEVASSGFDSEAFDKKRADAIKASREAGHVHLDKVAPYVETMRGKDIYYVHDPKVKGTIRTVDNRGNVYVNWADAYSADKEMASEVKDGRKTVMQSSLGPTDLKDYVLSSNRPPLDLAAQSAADLAAKEKQAAEGNVEEKTAAVRDRNTAILSAPEGTAPARSVEEQKVPTQQKGLFSRAPTTEAFKRWFGDSKVVDAEGKPLVVYHGAKRLDRMGPVIQKNRATSGPMPFFTDDKAIASKYAESKNDTSLPDEDRDYNAWFRLKVPGARNAVNIDRAWWHLSPEERDKIASLAPRVGNTDDGENHVLHPEGWRRGLGGYDQHIKEAHGNHLRALVEEWLNSAALYDREEEFSEILKLAGVDPNKVEMHSPWAEYPGVLPVYLSIKNPLRTSDISRDVVDALQKRANRQGGAERVGADIWAKETRDAREWMEALREDIKDQKNSHAWTSIPDWVTDTLKKLGYDGIIDRGGKLGGQDHGVYIPFEPTQVKSAIGNRGTFDPSKRNILLSRSSPKGPFASSIERQIAPILASWPNAPEVRVIQSMAEAPQAVREQDEGQRSQGAIGVPEAFIYQNVVYMVADGLTPARVTTALFHEALGHYGLRGTFGDRLDPILDEVAKSMPLRMKAKARQYGLNLSELEDRRQTAEEVLAELAQTQPTLGVMKKLIAAIRRFLRELGIHLSLSENDVIANYIVPARGYVERAAVSQAEPAPAFSRQDIAQAKKDLAEAKRIHKENPEYKAKATKALIARLEDKVAKGEAVFSRQAMTAAISQARQLNYSAIATKVVDRLDQALNPLGTLPEQDQFLIRRYEAQGHIEKADEAAKAIRAALPVASVADQQAVFDYLTTAGAQANTIADPATRRAAEQIKADINRVGDELVSHGLLSEESREQYRDAYLPRLYLKHLLSEQDWKALGAGKKPSDMGYLKGRKDIPEDVRKVILGEIQDPGFLAAVAVAKPMRDMALLDWLSDISLNDKWIMPGSVVNFTSPLTGRTQRATPFWLKDKAAQLRKQARYYTAEEAAKAETEAKAMDEAADDSLEGLQGTHADYKQIPNTARYGRLKGLLVRREIYDDLMGVQDFLPTDPGWFQNIFGYGGAGTKATQIWKAMKVSMNPPAQVRNFVSNGVLLQLSGVPLRMVPARVIQAARDIMSEGKYFQIAKKYGIGASTFSTQEVYRMKTELLDLEMKTRGMGPLGRLHRLAGLMMNKASDFYQMSETIFKTAKIIDAMEREGKSEQAAVLEANKWLFDYSLVQKSLRYARSAPIGVPFATFAVKVLPRLVEVATHHPQRFLPWVGLFYGFPMLVASMLGVDKDDLDKLKNAMPQWLQDKGHALILPWKDDQNRFQVADLGYFFPWTNWTELAGHLASGEGGKAIQSAGIFGGPLTDLVIAIKTGKDPFTGRDILAKGDPPERQAMALINYVWDMAMPPILTDHGLLSPMGALDTAYGGKLVQAITGTTNKFGEPRATGTQALLYAAGVNVNSLTPEYTRATNIQTMSRDLQDVKRQMVQKLQDRALSESQKKEIATEYAGEIIRRTEKLQKYVKESAIAPALATAH